MGKYRFAIFDSDGTLVDSLVLMRGLFNELAVDHGFRQVAPEEEPRFRKLHGRELLRALGLPLWKVPRVLRDLRSRMAAHLPEVSLYDGIAEMLEKLHRHGFRLAIVSSNSRENITRILGPSHAALIHHFDCGASLFGKASRLCRVLRRSGIPAERSIYIGDEVRDGEAAREAQVAFGAVTWGINDPGTLRAQSPAEVFHTPAEISARLCS